MPICSNYYHMGIKGLSKLINDEAADAVRQYKFSKISGKGWLLSIDASLMIYQTVIAMRSTGKDLKNEKGQLTSHLLGLFHKIIMFLQNNLIPIFVFDGKAPAIKKDTLNKRKQRIAEAIKVSANHSDSENEDYIKNFKQSYKLTSEHVEEAKILLDLMGIPYLIAPGEADVVCAWLATHHDASGRRYVKGVCSDDSDMLVLGTPYMFKDMSRFMSKNKPIKIISLQKILHQTNLSMDQFVDLCVLLGTDYSDNIKGIGPKNAFKLIRQHVTLEDCLNSLKVAEDSEAFKNMKLAQNYFKTAMNDLIDVHHFRIDTDQLTLKKMQENSLADFLIVKHNFDIVNIQSGINQLSSCQQKLGVTLENDRLVHQIIQPLSVNQYHFRNDFEIVPLPEE